MLAIIGGTGLCKLSALQLEEELNSQTEYGAASATLNKGRLFNKPILFLPRHGANHSIPPHLINYRANIQALKSAGANQIIAVNAVGGISDGAGPAEIIIPDQIIDYTYGREHTYSDGRPDTLQHIDFTYPYTPELRQALVWSAGRAGIKARSKGTYGSTQGPRLETPAEIRKLAKDGCDIVGMTGMPEAALARELEIDYASIALSVNWAAGITEDIITMEDIQKALDEGMAKVIAILQYYLLNDLDAMKEKC